MLWFLDVIFKGLIRLSSANETGPKNEENTTAPSRKRLRSGLRATEEIKKGKHNRYPYVNPQRKDKKAMNRSRCGAQFMVRFGIMYVHQCACVSI